MKLKTKLLIGTSIVISQLGTSACSTTDNNPETAQTISELKATEIALNTLKGGVVTNTHVDENERANKYEVNISKGDKAYEVDVDSLTGEVLEITQSSVGKINIDNESKLQNVSPKISQEDARRIALDLARGTITELDLDNFNDRLVYNIEIGSAYHREVKIIVDAMNGKVLKVEKM